MSDNCLYSECDLLLGNKPENDSCIQYESCKDCYRYSICLKAKEDFDKDIAKPRGCVNSIDALFERK